MKNQIKSIKILGSGCPKCKSLLEISKEVVSDLALGVEVDYISEINEIISLGVMSTPALLINDKVEISGYLPNKDEVIEKIKKYL